MTASRLFLAGLAASALVLAYSGDSFMAKFEAMPKAVQETASANMELAIPVAIASEKSEHGTEYTVKTRLNGKFHNLVINETGKLLAVKDETDLASIPTPAKALIEKESGALKITSVETVTEGAKVSYSALLKDDVQGKAIQLSVSADGTLRSKLPAQTQP